LKKKFIQACEITGSIYAKKRAGGKMVSPIHMSVNREELAKVYNKFYKDQVTALYRALHRSH
jgi:hypothetical protein